MRYGDHHLRIGARPDVDIDRTIRSVRESGGKVSNKLLRELPALADATIANEVAAAIQAAFAQG